MDIKDFTAGQTAYALTITRGRTTEHSISKYTVVSIGRKYVRATSEKSSIAVEFYSNHEEDEYLTENKDWGNLMKLFPTEQAALDDIEKYMLKSWLRKATENYHIDNYTLEQLRAAKEILEGHGNGKETEM